MKASPPDPSSCLTPAETEYLRGLLNSRQATKAEKQEAQSLLDADKVALSLRDRQRERVGGSDAHSAAAASHRERMAARSRGQFDAVADIGELPPVADPVRKARAAASLRYYLTESGYFPNSTGLSPISPSHERQVARWETSIRNGELAYAIVFRGFGKSTFAVNTMLWAGSCGLLKFVPAFGATKALGLNLIELMKSELETNPQLAADFPEICWPIRALEGKSQRCASQTYRGELTNIEWSAGQIVLPTIPGSLASGFCAMGLGLTGSLRGLLRSLPNGVRQRPDWFIVDDPQTDASALSPTQVEKRVNIIRKAICKLGGHQKGIGGVILGTPIQPDDLMDQLKDHDKFPQFQGETVKMVESFSDAHETLWMTDYARILTGFDPAEPGDFDRAKHAATKFYQQHRDEMDRGAKVAWDSCFDASWEISAVQHAYNFLVLDGAAVFAAECQMSPDKAEAEREQLVANDITTKLSGYPRGVVPPGTVKLTAMIDVQEQSLWYCIVAWLPSFCGYVIDYGVWPDQKRLDVSKSRLRTSLAQKYPLMRNLETRLRSGLSDLCDEILGRGWLDPEGTTHRIACALVDVGDGDVTLPVSSWVKTSKWSSILRPSKGLGIGAADTPLEERKKAERELRRGLNWVEMRQQKLRGISMVQFDANWWKSFLVNRWRAASVRPKDDKGFRPAEPGALYLYGLDPLTHRTFAAHQLAEYSSRTVHPKSGRSVDAWKSKPNRGDNEWFDALVGCAVAADYTGGISLKDSGLKMVLKKRKHRTKKATYLNV